MLKSTKLSITVLACVLLGSTGCLSSRALKSSLQSTEKNVTLLQTYDVYSVAYLYPVYSKHQFWKCSETPGQLTCAKACDSKHSDLVCPNVGTAYVSENVSVH